jgi:Flp pilus assembly protein TadG
MNTVTHRARAEGQALVEFALIFPVLILILAAILQFGLIFSSQIGITNSVREAARFASVQPVVTNTGAASVGKVVLASLEGGTPTDPACGSNGSLAGTVHPFFCAGTDTQPGLGPTAARVTYCTRQNDPPTDPNYSVFVTVSVTYNHPIILPIVGNIIDAIDGGSTPGSFQLSASEQMRVENQPDLTSSQVSTLSPCT